MTTSPLRASASQYRKFHTRTHRLLQRRWPSPRGVFQFRNSHPWHGLRMLGVHDQHNSAFAYFELVSFDGRKRRSLLKTRNQHSILKRILLESRS